MLNDLRTHGWWKPWRWEVRTKLIIVVLIAALLQVGTSYVVYRNNKASNDFAQCQYTLNQANAEISKVRSELLRNWMRDWLPIIDASKTGNGQAGQEIIDKWSDDLHAFLDTPIPALPGKVCGTPPSN
jgi:hypothetical protein